MNGVVSGMSLIIKETRFHLDLSSHKEKQNLIRSIKHKWICYVKPNSLKFVIEAFCVSFNQASCINKLNIFAWRK